MEQIIVDHVYPLLFVLKDEAGNRFLCICFDTRDSQQWLLMPIADLDLIALLEDRLQLQAPFRTDNGDKILAVLNYETREEKFTLCAANTVPAYAMPESGEYLVAEPVEWASSIRTLHA